MLSCRLIPFHNYAIMDNRFAVKKKNNNKEKNSHKAYVEMARLNMFYFKRNMKVKWYHYSSYCPSPVDNEDTTMGKLPEQSTLILRSRSLFLCAPPTMPQKQGQGHSHLEEGYLSLLCNKSFYF